MENDGETKVGRTCDRDKIELQNHCVAATGVPATTKWGRRQWRGFATKISKQPTLKISKRPDSQISKQPS